MKQDFFFEHIEYRPYLDNDRKANGKHDPVHLLSLI
jgi:hypothetical protein